MKCRHLCSGTVSSFVSGHPREVFLMSLSAATARSETSVLKKPWPSGEISDFFFKQAAKEKDFLMNKLEG